MEQANPKFSIIIPAYNQAKYLSAAIQSVLSQTYKDHEIIIIDDGSTDETSKIAAEFRDQIGYIYQENQGLAGARNTGILAARGELVGLLDSDDIWLPDYLETIISLERQNPKAVVYYSKAVCINDVGQELGQVVGGQPQHVKDLYWSLLRTNFLIPSTITIRRSVVLQAGLFDRQFRSCEDFDLWLRLLPEYEFVGTPSILVRYRVHEKSLSANPAKMQEAKRGVVIKHFGLDDEQYEQWTNEKRRAYGGLYRYYLLTSVQRQQEWNSGNFLYKAFLADPTLVDDLSLFYELALGSQPTGLRGSEQKLTLNENATKIFECLAQVFDHSDENRKLKYLRNKAYGTACKAIGLVGYNTGQLSISRKYLFLSLRRLEFIKDPLVVANIIRSILGKNLLGLLRQFRNKFTRETA